MINRQLTGRLLAAIAGLALAFSSSAQEIVAKPSKDRGVYEAGERIAWTVEVRNVPGKAQPRADLRYVLKRGGLTVMKEGTLPLTNGVGELTTSMAEPGTILVELK